MSTEQIGTVSVDTAEIVIVDAQYMLTDDDHDANRTAEQVIPGYDGVLARLTSDGVFPIFIDYDDSGQPLRVRIELSAG